MNKIRKTGEHYEGICYLHCYVGREQMAGEKEEQTEGTEYQMCNQSVRCCLIGAGLSPVLTGYFSLVLPSQL